MRILVIQMCRVGDILMTGPLLRGLRREHPSAHIALMVMDGFAHTPLPAHLYDRLIPFPFAGLTTQMSGRGDSWQASLDLLQGFLRDVAAEGPYTLVINLAHTNLSALVTSLVPATSRTGFVMRRDRRSGIDSAWMTYLRAAVRSREMGCFHLVDLFSWTGGVGRDALGLEIAITADERAWAEAFIETRALAGRPLIAMQLGASDDAKRWPVEHFAALADRLDPALGEIVLVGGPADRPLAAAFRAAGARPVADSTGETSLGQLAALLAQCQLLITNDTGPMHVAAAVGTRVLDLSSGPVSAFETGPYGDGHLVIEPETPCYPCPLDAECHHFACRVALTPADAAAVARHALTGGPVPVLSGARLLQGRRRARSGRIEFVPVGTPLTVKDRVRMAAAEVWERTLDAPPRAGTGWPEDDGALAADAGPHRDRWAVIHESLAAVMREATAAAAGARALPNASPAKVPALAAGIHATLERLLAIGESERAVHALVTHLRYEIDSVSATDLTGMAQAYAAAYASTAARARLLDAALRVSSPETLHPLAK